MARGRKKLEINGRVFQGIVNELEEKQTFENLSALWRKVCETKWAKNLRPRPLTPSVAHMRAKELGIKCKTQPGKRGRSLGEGFPGRRTRTPRKEKLKEYTSTFEELRKKVPAIWQGWVDKAEAGSMRFALNLKCVECACWQKEEVRHCTIQDCPIFPYRPYKPKDDKNSNTEENEEE